MSRVEALKLPRSGLTETMRTVSSLTQQGRPVPRLSGEFSPSSTPVDLPKPPKSEPMRQQWRAGISTEIQAILRSSGAPAANTSPIFGCSPPSRALNPLSQDSKFKTSRSSCSLSSAFASSAAGVDSASA